MTTWLLAILVLMAVAYWLVRRHESVETRGAGREDLDREALERAEEEVRDLDIHARPEDGFVGDDWGPGASKH